MPTLDTTPLDSTRHAAPADFVSLLAPMSLDEFTANHWNRRFAVIKGHADKFSGLMTWNQLTELLETNIPLHRVLVVKEGNTIEPARYITRPFMAPDGVLNHQALRNCLAAGATLLLSGIERHCSPLWRLVGDVERTLGSDTCINLYAGWRSTRGFELHWDEQDTVLMQVEGQKGWRVYEPTVPHPLRKHPVDPPTPTGEPVWEGVLEAGDALYLPRGWWHVPLPVEGPSLHLTMTIEPPTGLRFVEWLAKQASRDPLLRMNVPFLAGDDDQKRYLRQLRETLNAALGDDAIERFRRHCDSTSEARGSLLLPHRGESAVASLRPQSRVRLAVARALALEPHDDPTLLNVIANDKKWTCPAVIAPALRELRCDSFIGVESLSDALTDSSASVSLLRFLAMLALAGALTVENPAGH